MVNSYRRFPRAKYLRALYRIQRELYAWRLHYEAESRFEATRWSQSLLEERAMTMDWMWHEVAKLAEVFEQPLRWPK